MVMVILCHMTISFLIGNIVHNMRTFFFVPISFLTIMIIIGFPLEIDFYLNPNILVGLFFSYILFKRMILREEKEIIQYKGFILKILFVFQMVTLTYGYLVLFGVAFADKSEIRSFQDFHNAYLYYHLVFYFMTEGVYSKIKILR